MGSCALAGAAAAGWWLVPQYGAAALLWPVLAVAAIVVFARPVVGVSLLVATIPLENILVLGGDITWVRAVGLVVFSTWILRTLIRREPWAPVLSASLLKPAILFILLAVASILWATHVPSTVQGVMTTVQLLALSLLIVSVIDRWGRLEWVVRLVVVSGLALSILTVSQGFVDGLDRAGVDLAGGVNQTGAYLVLLLPFGFYLFRTSASRLWSLVGLLFVGLAPLAVILTFSRTSFVFLALVIGIQVWDMFKDGTKDRVLLTIAGLVVAVVLFTSTPWESALERASTISPAIQGGRGEDSRLESTRLHHWLGAIAIFNDYPILGSGYGNFGQLFQSYQFSVPSKYVQGYFTSVRGPHSSVLGIMAELGLVGIILWSWLLFVALLDARKSGTSSTHEYTRSQRLLVKAVFYSLLLYTMYGFITTIHIQKLLWVLLGLAAVVRRLASEPTEPAALGGD